MIIKFLDEEIPLKPCPFCGGEPAYIRPNQEYTWQTFCCMTCKMKIEEHTDGEMGKWRLAKKWNRRVYDVAEYKRGFTAGVEASKEPIEETLEKMQEMFWETTEELRKMEEAIERAEEET